ncbi:hypothetical protein D3C71_2012550 [compost metagenome]
MTTAPAAVAARAIRLFISSVRPLMRSPSSRRPSTFTATELAIVLPHLDRKVDVLAPNEIRQHGLDVVDQGLAI